MEFVSLNEAGFEKIWPADENSRARHRASAQSGSAGLRAGEFIRRAALRVPRHFSNQTMKLFFASFLLFVSGVACLQAAETSPYLSTKFPDTSGFGKNIQRTMLLLATSTAERRNTVRSLILFRDGESFLSGL